MPGRGGVGSRLLRALGILLMTFGTTLTMAEAQTPRDPHWDPAQCKACHTAARPGKGKARLRGQDASGLCLDCHEDREAHVMIHPDGPVPSPRLARHLADGFDERRLGSRRLSCTACHAPRLQCDPARKAERGLNPAFLRGGPYRFRTEFCYRCHDRKAYQRLNAHRQLDSKGQLLEERCRLCHRKVPARDASSGSADTALNIDDDYKQICLNCHVWVVHPGGGLPFMDRGGTHHLKVPPPGIGKRLKIMQVKNGIHMPLDPGGRIYCATCHNPHQRGVLRDPAAARGADEKYRLRMPQICDNCHDI